MKKRFLIPALFAGLLLVACSSDDDNNPPPPPDPGETIVEIEKLPYSDLTPDQQKVKLEADANELLKYGDAAKTSVSIEAFQTFESLLSMATIDIVGTRSSRQSVSSIIETVQYADVYGIYT